LEEGIPNLIVRESRRVKKPTTKKFLKQINSAQDLIEPVLFLILLRPIKLRKLRIQGPGDGRDPC
jgi:hypothetical protein